jgi:hypothetical protein
MCRGKLWTVAEVAPRGRAKTDMTRRKSIAPACAATLSGRYRDRRVTVVNEPRQIGGRKL